jgi:hypothetical protein
MLLKKKLVLPFRFRIETSENRRSRQRSVPSRSSHRNLFSLWTTRAGVLAVRRRRQRVHTAQTPEHPRCYGHLSRCPSTDRSVNPRTFPSLFERAMEPRGEPAVQIVPLMSSVDRGKNDSDRVEDRVSGPPLTLRFSLYFYR